MTKQQLRVEANWRNLAKAVLDTAFYDLNPDGGDHHVNAAKERKTAIAWFESRRFRIWAEAAEIDKGDVENAYLAITKGDTP